MTGNESKIFVKGVIGNVRKAQEDSHGYKLGTPNGDVYVVCDGMGGHVGGAKASSIAVDSILSYLSSQRYPTPVGALDGALQFANMQILGFASAHPEYRGMGTTACIVLVQGDDAWIAHVGDSRIYLYLGKEGRLHRLTKDHSFVQTLVDAGEITDEEAEHHPNKNRIMKALGIKPDLHPTFNHDNRPIHPKNGDLFLICSDGLTGMIPDRTIERVLGEKASLAARGDRLIELAMQGETTVPGGQDNCTVELIEVDGSPWKRTEFTSFNPHQADEPASTPRPSHRKPLVIGLVAVAAAAVCAMAVWLAMPKITEHRVKSIQTTIAEDTRQADSLRAEVKRLGEQLKSRRAANAQNLDTLKQLAADSIRYYKPACESLQAAQQRISDNRNRLNTLNQKDNKKKSS